MSIIKEFIQQKIYQHIDFFKERTINTSKPSLWHATKLKNGAQALNDGFLQPYTSHRYWLDGIRRKEDDPQYENSCWMYGWSMTRKREYAQAWSEVLFEFDSDKIGETFKIEPIAWNNLFKHNKSMAKKEFEEFVIAHYEPRSIEDMKQAEIKRDEQFDNLYDQLYSVKNEADREAVQGQLDKLKESSISWVEDWRKPRGKPLVVDKCVKGIYLNEFSFNLYMKDDKNSEGYQALLSIITHPLFKGLYQDPHANNNLRQSKAAAKI